MSNILLVNDDGLGSPGLAALASALSRRHDLTNGGRRFLAAMERR